MFEKLTTARRRYIIPALLLQLRRATRMETAYRTG